MVESADMPMPKKGSVKDYRMLPLALEAKQRGRLGDRLAILNVGHDAPRDQLALQLFRLLDQTGDL